MKDYSHPDNAYINAQDDPYMHGLLTSTPKVRRMTQNRKRKDGLVKVEIEIERYWYGGKGSYNRQKTFVDTLQWVDPKHWSNKMQKLSPKEPDYEVKNNKINQTYAAVYAFVSSKGQQEIDQAYVEGVDFSKLKELFPNRKENKRCFTDWINIYHKRRVEMGDKYGTTKEFITVKNRVQRFDESRAKKTQLEEINLTWSEDFYIFLRNTEKYGEGTIEKTFTIVKQILKYLYKRRREYNIDFEPHFNDDEFKWGKKSKNKPNAMSFDQRALLYNNRFETPYLERTRKMMCIQAFTGVRYGDISRITPDCIDGEFLKLTPKKTEKYDVEVVQPLNAESQALLEEVDYDTSVYSISNQKYNDYIQLVTDKLRESYPDAGFREKYSSHNMRDTFISVHVQKDVNFKSILLWVGQSSYAIMDRYIELTDEFNKKEMAKTRAKPDLSKISKKLMEEGGGEEVNLDDLPL
jgi:integrase